MSRQVARALALGAEALSKHYYRDLCDIEFFSAAAYRIVVGALSISVAAPGVPIWATAGGKRGTADGGGDRLRELYLQLMAGEGPGRIARADELAMSQILALETAYRQGDGVLLSRLGKIIDPEGPAASRAERILRAHQAREFLTRAQSGTVRASILTPAQRLRAQPIEYLGANGFDAQDGGWSESDVAVERPVRKDFELRRVELEDRDALIGFYRETLSYVFELTAANHQVETLSNYMRAIEVLRCGGVSTALDYGAGIGTFAILCAHNDIDCTYAELSSQTLGYGMWRVSLDPEACARITFAEVARDGDVPPGLWDAVICTEVLEHVHEPDQLIELLLAQVRSGGFLVVSESFDYVDEFCTHLPHHKGKGGKRFIDDMLRRGCEPVLVTSNCHVQVWRKPT